MDIQIRPFKPGDTDQLRAVWKSGLRQTIDPVWPSWYREVCWKRFQKYFEGPLQEGGDLWDISSYWMRDTRVMLVAASGEKILGCVGMFGPLNPVS